MDEPPSWATSPKPRRVPLWWRLQAQLATTLPQNERKRIKRLLSLGERWARAGFLDEADALYRRASELAAEARMHHLRKRAGEKRSALQEQLNGSAASLYAKDSS